MYVKRVPIEQASRLVSSSNEYYGSRQHEYTGEAVSAGVWRHSDTLGVRNLSTAGDSTECSSIGSYLSAASLEDEIEGLMSSQWNERNEDDNRGIPGIRAVQKTHGHRGSTGCRQRNWQSRSKPTRQVNPMLQIQVNRIPLT